MRSMEQERAKFTTGAGKSLTPEQAAAAEEIERHQSEPERERFWTIVYDSGAVQGTR